MRRDPSRGGLLAIGALAWALLVGGAVVAVGLRQWPEAWLQALAIVPLIIAALALLGASLADLEDGDGD